ncbi:transposase domain-containing protein [Microbispora sp. KK1-11]|uniref:transposase domain-containing protein n=1 Tax=Microbispora sp. KK1-11 TaxID=2053005 RepID=UPI00115BBF9C|nr:transposase domain-containing protein [Microbispora sp. KK1-11]TQS26190.1 transposase [Microbispora sp. KK1-11]
MRRDADGRLPDWLSIGVVAASIPRETVDRALLETGRQARRSDGKLPPYLMVYFAMGMALFPDGDYEDVAGRLIDTFSSWGCWDPRRERPTSGGITQARRRLGHEPLRALFARVAVPVADPAVPGAFLGPWRIAGLDAVDWDAPDSKENVAEFGYGVLDGGVSALPRIRLVTVTESASRTVVAAEIGGQGENVRTLARRLYPRLGGDWLLIAGTDFFGWPDWCGAARTGAQLLWRVPAGLPLAVVAAHDDGSATAVLVDPDVGGEARDALVRAASAGHVPPGDPGEAGAALVRALEYETPGGERVTLVTTITDPAAAPAEALARAHHEWAARRAGRDELNGLLRGPGRVLRSHSPEMVRQEIYGYLLAHRAIGGLVSRAAAEAAGPAGNASPEPGIRVLGRLSRIVSDGMTTA